MRLRSRFVVKLLQFASAIAASLILACGADGGADDAGDQQAQDDAIDRVIAVDRRLTLDDLTALGMKKGKSYDVATLPGGVEAYLLYWRVDGTAVEYEARMYESHASAVELGTGPAEEGSGEDAILDDDKADYDEGIRDRRTIFDFRAEPKPKYGAFAIYGNVVVLCEGRDDAEAWHRCSSLIEVLEE